VTELRGVADADLPHFFEHQRDPAACRMAAFTAKDPNDRAAFDARWSRIRSNPAIVIRTVLLDGAVVGHVLSFEETGQREVSYWIAREHWGRGVATAALRMFLDVLTTRPLHARVATDNAASRRVLEKCGFSVVREGKWFANARGAEIGEFLLHLS
jgi:RimJ/RimL family protein N-acetyltransferase